MASEVDICNLALSHLGDVATVASINPPSGDAQSAHCARFYPIARDAVLEMHTWGFATTRSTLALNQSNPASNSWAYCYATPSDVVNYVAILDPAATDDYSVGIQMAGVGPYSAPIVGAGVYTPQPFVVESDANGNDVILTNQQGAVLRYTRAVTDTTKFTPLFILSLSHLLASMLAGPLLKGEVGQKVAAEQLKLHMAYQVQAEGSDANQRRERPAHGPQWMTLR